MLFLRPGGGSGFDLSGFLLGHSYNAPPHATEVAAGANMGSRSEFVKRRNFQAMSELCCATAITTGQGVKTA
jgi:hypothetical protein